MNVIVCVKQVPDPEALTGSLGVDTAAKKVILPPGVTTVLSPFDANAVEAALRIKDEKGCKITVMSLGNHLIREVVKSPLAMGCDELVLLEDEAFENGDSFTTAYALSEAIRKIGDYQIVFCGRQSADWDAGQVGSGIAELLGIPSVSLARKVEVRDDRVVVERLIADGIETVEAPMPCLITVSNELGEPRYATLKRIIAAGKKQPVVWKPEDIGVAVSDIGERGRKTELLGLFKPVKETKCEILEGETAEEAAAALAIRLREARVL